MRITSSNISELDGYPFIRFIVHVSYPPPPSTPSNAVLPSVDTITINYNAALNCPAGMMASGGTLPAFVSVTDNATVRLVGRLPETKTNPPVT